MDPSIHELGHVRTTLPAAYKFIIIQPLREEQCGMVFVNDSLCYISTLTHEFDTYILMSNLYLYTAILNYIHALSRVSNSYMVRQDPG